MFNFFYVILMFRFVPLEPLHFEVWEKLLPEIGFRTPLTWDLWHRHFSGKMNTQTLDGPYIIRLFFQVFNMLR